MSVMGVMTMAVLCYLYKYRGSFRYQKDSTLRPTLLSKIVVNRIIESFILPSRRTDSSLVSELSEAENRQVLNQ